MHYLQTALAFCLRQHPRAQPLLWTLDDFMEVLRGWGNMWIWDDLQICGGTEWVFEAIMDESMIAVCDGSYIRQIYPNLCLAALITECTKG